MKAKEFIDFIKLNKYESIDELFSYSFKEKMLDVVTYFCQKRALDIPPKYKILYYNYQNISKKRFNIILPYLDLLSKNQINYVVIKGPILSKYLYGDFFKRQYGDIDIIVDSNDYIRMHNLLSENGFQSLFIDDSFNKKQAGRYAFNNRGVDIIYSKEINDFEVGFEIRDSLRLLNKMQTNKILSYKIESKIENFSFYSLEFIYNIVLQIIYTYNAYFTEYGVMNQYKIKYLIELHLLLNIYKSINKEKLKETFDGLELSYMYNAVFKYYDMIFENKLNAESLDILELFDDKNYRLNNYYTSLYKGLQSIKITNDYNINTFNNVGKHLLQIIRPFNKVNVQNSLYFSYDIFVEKENIIFFISFPRKLSDITFQIILIDKYNYQYSIELTFYHDFINEYRSSISFDYAMNYFDHNKRCFLFKISKQIFEKYIIDKEFLFKILLRKILANKYPLMTDEYTQYIRFHYD